MYYLKLSGASKASRSANVSGTVYPGVPISTCNDHYERIAVKNGTKARSRRMKKSTTTAIPPKTPLCFWGAWTLFPHQTVAKLWKPVFITCSLYYDCTPIPVLWWVRSARWTTTMRIASFVTKSCSRLCTWMFVFDSQLSRLAFSNIL